MQPPGPGAVWAHLLKNALIWILETQRSITRILWMSPVVISINLVSVQHLALIHFLNFINKMCHRKISGHMNMEKMSTKENIKEQVKNNLCGGLLDGRAGKGTCCQIITSQVWSPEATWWKERTNLQAVQTPTQMLWHKPTPQSKCKNKIKLKTISLGEGEGF